MAGIVCAYGTSHILFDPSPAREAAARIVAGMQALGRRMAEARPDVMLMITNEHMFNINLRVQPPFSIGISDAYEPFGDMGIPKRAFPGQREFASALAGYAAREGFDLALCDGIRPDHGVTLPLLFIKPWGSIPTVPLYVNVNMTPPPAMNRCLALARTIRDWIETERPAGERVAIVASGGLSHWLNIPGTGTVAEEFDREFLRRLAAGDRAEYARLSMDQLQARAGNGGLEMVNWLMMAEMVPGARGEQIYYEPMRAWMTGLGGLALHVGAA
jgi:aromatic ring-opening dioxygenase catalytic subunit (LigB family)